MKGQTWKEAHERNCYFCKRTRVVAGLSVKLPALFLPNEKTAEPFFGFFALQRKNLTPQATAHIPNDNTRRPYYKTACRFSECARKGGLTLGEVKAPHVAAYIKMLVTPEMEAAGLSKPPVKQHLAGLRMLFDWLVVGHALEINPAYAVRRPRYSQKRRRYSTAGKPARSLPASTPSRSRACATGHSAEG